MDDICYIKVYFAASQHEPEPEPEQISPMLQDVELNTIPWYQVYVDYAKENGLIDRNYDSIVLTDCDTFAQIFANLISSDEYPVTNADIAFGDIGRASHPSAIRKLTRAGIVEGSQNASGQLVYKTDDPITHAEIAAIVIRIADSSLRLDAGRHTLGN